MGTSPPRVRRRTTRSGASPRPRGHVVLALPTSSSSWRSTSPVSVWRQPPTIRPSHQAVGPALPFVSNSCALCGPRYQSRSNHPIVVGSNGGRSAGQGSTSGVGSRSSGSTYPVWPSRSTSSASRWASALRVAATVDPSHHLMSATVPGPNVCSHRSTSPATPRTPEAARSPRRARRPSRSSGVARSSTRRRWMPARCVRRRTAWSAPAGRPAGSRPTTSPRRRRSRPRAAGSRRAVPTTWPPVHPTRPRGPARSPCLSQRSPLFCSPASSTWRISRRRSVSATRLLAPACAKLSVARGKTNRVRRIARCLTSDRST